MEISEHLEVAMVVAFGKIGYSPFQNRSIPGGDAEHGPLLAAEKVVMQGTGSTGPN